MRGKDFEPEVKKKLRLKRHAEGVDKNQFIEVDHIVPRYLGGSSDEENGEGLTRSEHLGKHFRGAYFPEPEQNPDSELAGLRQVLARSSSDDITEFLGDVKPLIGDLQERLREKRKR